MTTPKYTAMPQRNGHYTKTGPGRKHKQGAKTDDKSTASLKAGAYGRGLRNHFNRMNAQRHAQRSAVHSTASHAKRAA